MKIYLIGVKCDTGWRIYEISTESELTKETAEIIGKKEFNKEYPQKEIIEIKFKIKNN